MYAVVLPLPSSSQPIYTAGGCLVWHAAKETTGSSTAGYTLWDNPIAAAGIELMPVTLSAGESTRDYIKKHHLPFRNGLYFNLDSGAVAGSVSVLINHDCRQHMQEEIDMTLAIIQALATV